MNCDAVSIHTNKYWQIVNNELSEHPDDDYFLTPSDQIDEIFLGLAPIIVSKMDYDHTFKYFKIINKEKFLWIKLKYDI